MPRAELAREPDGAGNVDSRGAAEQQSLLDHEIEDNRQRFVIRDLIGEIDWRALEVGRDAALADPLGYRGARTLEFAGRVVRIECGAHGIGERDLDAGVAFLQSHAHSRQRAAGPDRADEAVYLAVEIVEYLRSGRLIMPLAVGDVVELVRPDRAA